MTDTLIIVAVSAIVLNVYILYRTIRRDDSGLDRRIEVLEAGIDILRRKINERWP